MMDNHEGQSRVSIRNDEGETIFEGTAEQFSKAAQKMKENPGEPQFSTVSDHTYGVAAAELRAFVERFERLEAEKQDIAQDQKEVMAEAKGRGYDTKVLRKVIALRKRSADDIAEEEAILSMYRAALGM